MTSDDDAPAAPPSTPPSTPPSATPPAPPSFATAARQLFDAVGARYEQAFVRLPELHAALDWMLERLPPGAAVLDIGSGTGRPAAERLAAAGHRVTGVDVSPAMVELARARVPKARFEVRDVREMPAADGGWDGICAFFPLLQMSRADVDATLAKAAGWLAPDGCLALATAPFDAEDVAIEWMGHATRATSYPAEVFGARLRAAGLVVEHERVSVFDPDDPDVPPEEQLFLHARKPPAPAA